MKKIIILASLLATIVYIATTTHTQGKGMNDSRYPEPKSKAECMQLFKDILKIQEEREEGFQKMNSSVLEFQWGKLTKRDIREESLSWQKKDRALRIKVGQMYDAGYSGECFSKKYVEPEIDYGPR